MKLIYKITLLSICISSFLFRCAILQPKEKFIFPKEMLPHVQKDYLSMCKKGEILYKVNCAKCHNTGRRKTEIPEFNNDQLIGYTLRTTNREHENSIQDSVVTEEELVLIMHFLNYRKK